MLGYGVWDIGLDVRVRLVWDIGLDVRVMERHRVRY